MIATDACGLVVLETEPGPRRAVMAKTFARTGGGEIETKAYDQGFLFRFHVRHWPDLAAMAFTLKGLEHRPYHCIVRGAPADGLDLGQYRRRLLYPAEESRSASGRIVRAAAATLQDVPRCWVELDFDHSPPLADGFDWRADPRGALERLMKRDLPVEFHDVDCVAMFSSSAGFGTSLKWRAFFLLDRAYGFRELTAVLKLLNGRHGAAQVDPALARGAQPHYIATPIFGDGVEDPLPGGRMFVFEKSSRRAVLPEVPFDADGGSASGGNYRPFTGKFPRAVMAKLDEMKSGADAFHMQWIAAMGIWFDTFGPEVDPVPLIGALDDVLRDHAVPLRGERYRREAFRQMCDFAVTLRTRQRREIEAMAAGRHAALLFPDPIPPRTERQDSPAQDSRLRRRRRERPRPGR